MNSSVAIIIMMGDRYVSFLTGTSTLISCVGYRAQLIMNDEAPLGRHSTCGIIVNRGHIRYGDIFMLYSGLLRNDNYVWYIKQLMQMRRRYTRRRGRGMSGRDIMSCITDMLDNCGERFNPFAVICCERDE